MIKLENLVTPSNEQWIAAIRGMRNPMNSWNKSDTKIVDNKLIIGATDLDLMKRLIRAGSEHRKFLRMLTVTLDISMSLYVWKEADTYQVGTAKNSCSTMHKIHAAPFTLADFSHEHLITEEDTEYMNFLESLADETTCRGYLNSPLDDLNYTIEKLNLYREAYLRTKDKKYWWQLIQTLPDSYIQRRTFHLNYETLYSIVHQRKGHKLDEWHEFIDFIKTNIPYAAELLFDED